MTSVMVLTPGNAAENYNVDPDSTVQDLLDRLVDEGKVEDASDLKALNDRSEGISFESPIGENRAISFMVTLAGA